MIWNVVYDNLKEASGDIRRLHEMVANVVSGRTVEGDFDELAFYTSMHHVYHHLNWAWNCRNKDEQRAIRCDFKDFYAWQKFPRNFKDLYPPLCARRGVPREVYGGKLVLEASAVAFAEAERATNSLCCSLLKTLGREIFEDWLDGRCADDVPPISEKSFESGMGQLYRCLNRAWNERKIWKSSMPDMSRRTLRRHAWFPRAFRDLW